MDAEEREHDCWDVEDEVEGAESGVEVSAAMCRFSSI